MVSTLESFVGGKMCPCLRYSVMGSKPRSEIILIGLSTLLPVHSVMFACILYMCVCVLVGAFV